MGTSSVSALQEYCTRCKIFGPVYKFICSEDGSFECQVEILDMDAFGHGRSKRVAKDQAASNIIKKLRPTHPGIAEISLTSHMSELPPHDMIVVLRDYCVQHRHPLPTVEIVQQSGTADAPEFMALCTIASIKRYGVSKKKEDARQLAALEMYKVITDDSCKLDQQGQVPTLGARAEEVEAERYQKFKTYRELTKSDTSELPSVKPCERHNFFNNFHESLKAAARAALAGQYESSEAQALAVLRALQIKPKITPMVAETSAERMLFIELDCDYDAVFAGIESKVYDSIVRYFRDML